MAATPVEADLVLSSGREEMSIKDRAGLLRVDMDWLRGQKPPMPREASKRRAFFNVNGASIHDANCLIGYADSVVHLLGRGSKISLDRLGLSELECQMMAWRRGGHAEYKRTRARQKALR